MKRTEYFTKREYEIAELLKFGYSNIQIAKQLGCSSSSVKKYINSMNIKINSKNRTELVFKLCQIGFYNL